MTDEQEIKKEMKAMKEMIAEIHAAIVIGIGAEPGKYEYDRALQEFVKGNRKPLELYIKRGGKPRGGKP